MTASEEQAILEQLENLSIAKEAIRTAIHDKYVDVSESTPLIKYADAIRMIGSGIGGTYGKSKAAMPLPPEGNFGGGVNPKLAWRKGQTATLIKPGVESDYPATPTFIIDTKEKFDLWRKRSDAGSPSNEYKIVLLKVPTTGKYVTDRTIDFTTINTDMVFAENGVVISFDSSSQSDNKDGFEGTRFLFKGKGASSSLLNISAELNSAKDRFSQEIGTVRGIQIISGTTDVNKSKFGDLITDTESLSRVYVESWGYVDETASYTLDSKNSKSDMRSGQGAVIAAAGKVSDVTIRNMSTTFRGKCGFGTSGAPKLVRCYVLGSFDVGIDFKQEVQSSVDRCYVQSAHFSAASNKFAIRAGTIINTTLAHVESRVDQKDNGDNLANYGMYAIKEIKGCKIGNCVGSAIVAMTSTQQRITESAVVNYSFSGKISGNPGTSGIFKAQGEISHCTVYKINTIGQLVTKDLTFYAFNSTSSEIKNNNIGEMRCIFTYNTGEQSTSASIGPETNKLNIRLFFGGSKQKDNRVDSVYIEDVSHTINNFRLFENCAEIDNNFVNSVEIYSDWYWSTTPAISGFGLIKTTEQGRILNNVIDNVKVSIAGFAGNFNFICLDNAKTVQNNRISSVKIKDISSYSYNSGTYDTRYLNATGSGRYLTGISINYDDSIIEGNSFGNLCNDTTTNSIYSNIKVVGIDNNESKKADIRNNFFKNISVMGVTGSSDASNKATNDLLISRINAVGVRKLAAVGIIIPAVTNGKACKIINNELNVECLSRTNALRSVAAGSYDAAGVAAGILVGKLHHIMQNNIVSLRGSAKQMRCIKCEETATSANSPTSGPQGEDSNSSGNKVSLVNTSYNFTADTTNIMIENIQKIENTTLILDRDNTITKATEAYKNCFSVPSSHVEDKFEYRMQLKEDGTPDWILDAEEGDKIFAGTTQITQGGPNKDQFSAAGAGGAYYFVKSYKFEWKETIIDPPVDITTTISATREGDFALCKNEVPVVYHVYV